MSEYGHELGDESHKFESRMSMLDDQGSETMSVAGEEVNANDVETQLNKEEAPVLVVVVKDATLEECSRPIHLLQKSKQLAVEVEHLFRGQMEVRCGNTLQGLWSVQRPRNCVQRSGQLGFAEVGISLKGAITGCNMNGEEGRAGLAVVELLAALSNAGSDHRVMVEPRMQQFGAGDEYRNKLGLATTANTDELYDAIVLLGQDAEYGGLKCFKAEEVEEDFGTKRKVWLLSPGGQRQALFGVAGWTMQTGVYVHGFGPDAFNPLGDGAAFVRAVLGSDDATCALTKVACRCGSCRERAGCGSGTVAPRRGRSSGQSRA